MYTMPPLFENLFGSSKVGSPQCAVITSDAMNKYLQIFNLLWNLKRVEWYDT
jgi:hypothetical protein